METRNRMTLALVGLQMLLVGSSDRDAGDERGDVPGWVLVTVMTAGLVAALWAVAGGELTSMLRAALGSVS